MYVWSAVDGWTDGCMHGCMDGRMDLSHARNTTRTDIGIYTKSCMFHPSKIHLIFLASYFAAVIIITDRQLGRQVDTISR